MGFRKHRAATFNQSCLRQSTTPNVPKHIPRLPMMQPTITLPANFRDVTGQFDFLESRGFPLFADASSLRG